MASVGCRNFGVVCFVIVPFAFGFCFETLCVLRFCVAHRCCFDSLVVCNIMGALWCISCDVWVLVYVLCLVGFKFCSCFIVCYIYLWICF